MTASAGSDISGRCLCGAVSVRGRLADPEVAACHCGQCRRWSGHVWASFSLRQAVIAGPVRWFRSSAKAERGFCPDCGASLFWRRVGSDDLAVAAGAIDNPTGLRLARHIFVADRGDYYDIADGLPQRAGS